jgi:hypothetical protein
MRVHKNNTSLIAEPQSFHKVLTGSPFHKKDTTGRPPQAFTKTKHQWLTGTTVFRPG